MEPRNISSEPVKVGAMGPEIALAPPRPANVPTNPRRAPSTPGAPAPLLNKSSDEIKRAGSRASVLWQSAVEEGFPFVFHKTARDATTREFIPFEVRVRRPPMQFVMSTGRLPANIKSRVNDLIAEAKKHGQSAIDNLINDPTLEDMELAYGLAVGTALAASIDPVFYEPHPHDRMCHMDGSPANPATEVPVDVIDYDDLMALFNWCNHAEEEEAAEVAAFPVEQAATVDAGPEGEALRSETI